MQLLFIPSGPFVSNFREKLSNTFSFDNIYTRIYIVRCIPAHIIVMTRSIVFCSTYSSLRWLPFADHQFIGCAEEKECVDVRRKEFCRHNTQGELLVASRQSWHCTNRTRWNTHTRRIVCWKKVLSPEWERGERRRGLSVYTCRDSRWGERKRDLTDFAKQ